MDGYVRFHVHGITDKEVRVEKYWISIHDLQDFLDLVVMIRERWNDFGEDRAAVLYYVDSQPAPRVYGGQDLITLVLDLAPEEITPPIVIITRVDQLEFEDTFDVMTFRTNAWTNCQQMKDVTGLSMVCRYNARCTCTHNHNRIDDTYNILVQGGQMLMIHIYLEQIRCDQGSMETEWTTRQERTTDGDEVSSMQVGAQTRLLAPFERPWLYGYGYGRTEPIRAYRHGAGGIPEIQYLATLYAGQTNTFLSNQVIGFTFCAATERHYEDECRGLRTCCSR